MTHDELLSKIDSYLIPTKAHLEEPNFAVNTLQALRAVVELHKPIKQADGFVICDSCSNSEFFPYKDCQTIQAIEKELV